MVNDDKENTLSVVKILPQIPDYVSETNQTVGEEQSTLGFGPGHAMHNRVTLVVGFILEGLVAVTVRLHLLRKKGLYPGNPGFHRVGNVWVERAVVG